jgi:hypothetical protein
MALIATLAAALAYAQGASSQELAPVPANGATAPIATPAATPSAPPARVPSTSLWELSPREDGEPTARDEVVPEVIYLPDEQGRPTRLLGWRMDDFLRAWRWMQAGLSQPPVNWEITSISLSGVEQSGCVEFEARVELRVHGQGWHAVPIDLREGILRTPLDELKFSGGREHRLEIAPEGGGYRWHVLADGDADCALAFRFAVALSRQGQEHRCALHLPAAAISKIQLVPTGKIGATSAVPGVFLAPPESLADGTTRLTVEGARGDFWLSWQEALPVAAVAALEAETRYRVKVDGPLAQVEADLSIRGVGGTVSPFILRAPAAWRLLSSLRTEEAALAPLTDDKGGTGQNAWQVTPLATDRARLRLPLQFSLPLDAAGEERSLRIEGLEAAGALRHTALVSVEIPDDWQADWQSLTHAQRTTTLPIDELVPQAGDYFFEAYRQPFALEARLSRAAARVSVEPRYEIDVDAMGARVRATFRLSPQVGRLTALEIERQGWIVDRIEPAETFAIDPTASTGDVLAATLRTASAEPLELTLLGHRSWNEAPRMLSVALPCVRSESQSAARVVVRPKENVLLAPLAGQTESLLREPSTAADPDRALVFRGSASSARLACEMQVLPQRVTVRGQSQVQLDAGRARIDQEFAYRVDFEPLDLIELELPSALWNAALSVTVGGVELAGAADAMRSRDAPLQLVRYRLPQAQLGAFQVRLSATLDLPAAGDEMRIPLAAPTDGKLETHLLSAKSNVAGDLVSNAGPWRPVPGDPREPTSALLLQTSERSTEVTLRQSSAGRSGTSTIVERAWLQSWYLAGTRQERVVFRLRSGGQRFECWLPEEAEVGGLTVSLRNEVGGQSIDLDPATVLSADRRISAPLPKANDRDARFVLELRYPCSLPATGGSRTLHPPRLPDGVWVQQVCWQLLLPPDEHVVSRPDGFSHEFQWAWQRLYWGRQPVIEQSELEAWSGGEPSGFAPGDASRYVFNSAGALRPLTFSTARRSELVLGASLVAFVAAVALRRTASAWRPLALTGTLGAIAAIALWRPDAAALGGQAAALGLLLGVISLWLERRWTAGHFTPRPAPSTAWPVQRGSSLTRSLPTTPSVASTSSAPALPPSAHENGSSLQ